MTAFLDNPLLLRAIATVVLITVTLAVRYGVGRWLTRHTPLLAEHKRRQLFYLRTGVTAGLALGIILIWGGHLQNLMLSLTAVMVAVVIATKELLMCLSGFTLRMSARLFAIGDWIECNGLHGEVTEHTLLSTTLLEISNGEQSYGYTGRNLVLPNSIFLSHPVRVSPFARQFVLHRFAITLEGPILVDQALAHLERIANEACAPFAERARQVNTAMDHKLGVDIAGPEPSVLVTTSELGNPRFTVRLFAPTEQAPALERQITSDFLTRVYSRAFTPPSPTAAEPAATGATGPQS